MARRMQSKSPNAHANDENASYSLPAIPTVLGEYVEQSFIDYATSVIVDRALPNIADGFKPVQRRILFDMHEQGVTANRPYVKSASIVGATMGGYHPHGDASIYEALVRMAQSWTMLHPLIDGHGNFGSRDNDPPAAMRYTECRLTSLSQTFFEDISKGIVPMMPTFDGSRQEPVVLPVAYPQILVNGGSGIAVGMATSIPTHNLREVIDAFIAWMDNRSSFGIRDVLRILPAPDFPTGGIVYDLAGFEEAMRTGRGYVRLRGNANREHIGKKECVVITSLPYGVDKSQYILSIDTAVRDNTIRGIDSVVDESSRGAIRIVVTLDGSIPYQAVLDQLYSSTQLDISISYNMTVLLPGNIPSVVGILDIFQHFFDFRMKVIRATLEANIRDVRRRLHLFEGFVAALNRLDLTISIIRKSENRAVAGESLRKSLGIDEIQSQAILEMQIQRLTALDREDIARERVDLEKSALDMEATLASERRLKKIIRDSAAKIRDAYGRDRQTTCDANVERVAPVSDVLVVPDEPVFVLRTANGYMHRFDQADLQAQGRGTRGKRMLDIDASDKIEEIMATNTHAYLVVFSQTGQCYSTRIMNIPESTGKGKHINSIIDRIDAPIAAMFTVPNFSSETTIATVTAKGLIKRTEITDYEGSTRNGGIAGVKIKKGDVLIGANIVDNSGDALMVANDGMVIRFPMNSVRPSGRATAGMRGMTIGRDSRVHSFLYVPKASNRSDILFITEYGHVKRMSLDDIKRQARSGKGTRCVLTSPKTGSLVGAAILDDGEMDIVCFTERGVANRVHASSIKRVNREAHTKVIVQVQAKDAIKQCSVVPTIGEE